MIQDFFFLGKMPATENYEFLPLYRGVNVVKEEKNREIILSNDE